MNFKNQQTRRILNYKLILKWKYKCIMNEQTNSKRKLYAIKQSLQKNKFIYFSF